MAKNLFLLFLASCIASAAVSQDNLKLWYNKPASNWNEALPLGNGRLGAMVFGKVDEELIQLPPSAVVNLVPGVFDETNNREGELQFYVIYAFQL